ALSGWLQGCFRQINIAISVAGGPGSFSCPAWAGNGAGFPGNAGLQPGSRSHAGAWRSQVLLSQNRNLNSPAGGPNQVDVMLMTDEGGAPRTVMEIFHFSDLVGHSIAVRPSPLAKNSVLRPVLVVGTPY